jgi:hypothetical protein
VAVEEIDQVSDVQQVSGIDRLLAQARIGKSPVLGWRGRRNPDRRRTRVGEALRTDRRHRPLQQRTPGKVDAHIAGGDVESPGGFGVPINGAGGGPRKPAPPTGFEIAQTVQQGDVLVGQSVDLRLNLLGRLYRRRGGLTGAV